MCFVSSYKAFSFLRNLNFVLTYWSDKKNGLITGPNSGLSLGTPVLQKCWICLYKWLIVIHLNKLSRNEAPPHFKPPPWTEHLNTSGITSHGTDSFCVKPITPGHPIPKISTHLTIFWGHTWKIEFAKTIHRQERTSLEEKSDGFHKKCSIELWTILMFELLLCCHTAAQCMERT